MTPLAAVLAMGQQQPRTPPQTAISPTDVTAAYRDSQNAAMQAYAAKMQQVNALWGGLAGLGSAGILTLPKLLSGGAPGATIPTAIGNSVAGMDAATPGLTTAAAPAASDAMSFAAPAADASLSSWLAAPTGAVAADLAATAPADATAASALAGGFSLADLLPLLALA